MYRYQILIEYVGTNFVGWQIQAKGKSIQKLIQLKLSKLLKEKVSLLGSGRTDAGVHAIEQSAHFDCKKEIQNIDKFLKSVNHFVNNMGVSILNIKNAESANIEVYDILGKLLLTKSNISFEEQINVSNFQVGTYFIKLSKENQVSTERFIVSKEILLFYIKNSL